MGVLLTLEPKLVEFSIEERDAWRAGERSDCIDPYCAGTAGGRGSTTGFGEYMVGKYWQRQGYRWVHHDFDIFGGNIDHKYPSQAILENALAGRLAQFKTLVNSLRPFQEGGHAPVEQADLLIYKPGTTEIRFAECKRADTHDKVNGRQALGLFLIASQLQVPVDVFLVAEKGTRTEPLEPIRFVYGEHGVRIAG